MVYLTFPFRLYSILEDSAKDAEESSIVSWTPGGTAFKIHDLEAFKDHVLPKYLPKQSKYKSFKRQLQYYGFINYGANQYGHPSFQKGDKSLLCKVEHRSLKKTKVSAVSSSSLSNSSKKDSNLGKASASDLLNYASSNTLATTSSLSRVSGAAIANRFGDTLLPSHFAAPSMVPRETTDDLYKQLLLSRASSSLQGYNLASLPRSLMISGPTEYSENPLLSLSQQQSPSKKEENATNDLLSKLMAAQRWPTSSFTSSPAGHLQQSLSAALDLELGYQCMKQQENQEAAMRARIALCLANQSIDQTLIQQLKQQQQRRESLEKLAILNELSGLSQQFGT